MKRQVKHAELVKGRACTCGARFRTPRELRKHINSANKALGVKR